MRRLFLLAAALAVLACGGHTLRGADPKRPVALPRDHAAHGDAQTEWWHFHGHVVDDAGRRYDWFLAFVRQHTDLDRVAWLPVRWFVDPFYVAYFTVTDRGAGTFQVREKHSFPDTWAATARQDRLALRHDSWRAAAGDDGSIRLQASTRREGMDLRIRPAKPAALMNGTGYLDIPPRSAHYYYSLPRMEAEGTITVGGEQRAVRGLAWLKHEWGFMYTPHLRGWVWFGAQLSSGAEVEIGLIFDHDWNLADGSFARIAEADGRLTPIDVRTLGVLEGGDTWRSPRTGTVYPTSWILEVPGRGRLILEAVVDGQEMVVFPANLWAGTLDVSGAWDGEAVTGDCFGEVVGLDEPFGRSLLRSGRP